MRKDYQFLIGQRFSVGGEIYVVSDLTRGEEHTYVEANTSERAPQTASDYTSEPALAEIVVGEARAEAATETFKLSDVIQWLLVDEEIELFNPNYLAAR